MHSKNLLNERRKNNSQPCVGVSLPCPLGCGFPERGMGYVLVTAVFLASPGTEPGTEGIGRSYGRVTVCAKIFLWADLWEPVLGFLFRKGGNGGYLWDFHKHLQGFSPGGGEHPPYFGEWEMSDITYCHFGFLCVPWIAKLIPAYGPFHLLFPLCGNSVLTALGIAVTLWLKKHLRKVCTGLSSLGLHFPEALVSSWGHEISFVEWSESKCDTWYFIYFLIVGTLGPKFY